MKKKGANDSGNEWYNDGMRDKNKRRNEEKTKKQITKWNMT